jgi:transposase
MSPGSLFVGSIGNALVRVYLFVGALGYSRWLFVIPFRHERQSAWFDGLETAFHHLAAYPSRCCSTMLARLSITTMRQRGRRGSRPRLRAFALCATVPMRHTGRGPGTRTDAVAMSNQTQCRSTVSLWQLEPGGASCLVDARDRRFARAA